MRFSILLAALLSGCASMQPAVREASYRSRRRACDHQLRGDELPFPGYNCVRASEFSHLAQSGEVTIIGKSTTLGIHVAQVTPGANKPFAADRARRRALRLNGGVGRE